MPRANKIRGFALVAIAALVALTVAAQQRVPQWQIDAGVSAKFEVASLSPTGKDVLLRLDALASIS